MGKEHAELMKENSELKEKVVEAERYKRRWNLKVSGLKERDGEDILENVEGLLLKLWTEGIEDVIDSVHRVGRKQDDRSRQVQQQFVRRRHRDEVWKKTKDSSFCRDHGLRSAQDFTTEDRQARDQNKPEMLAKWPFTGAMLRLLTDVW